ncbi:MAG: sugar phosphate isomerase/epimerase [Nocardioidaceae bacterium]|nr:sugar phosphate isomerase/epimerase [Nocardioidaceae bacterium]MCL2613595.1 sugar phosphate isomerase/epimerase [Nocardioidaceae bacterium]
MIRWRRGLSTLGCLELTFADTCRLTREHGVEGLELRTGLTPLPPVAEMRQLLASHDLSVLAVASSARLADPAAYAATAHVLRADVELALALEAAYVRVFPGGTDRRTVARHLSALDNLDPTDGPVLALETHDHLPTGRAVADLVTELDDPRLGAVWDALHPWRAGEAIGETAEALLPLRGYVQVKDAALDDPTPRLLGTGAVPLDALRTALEQHAYGGWVSLEWERAWYPDVPPLADVLADTAGW